MTKGTPDLHDYLNTNFVIGSKLRPSPEQCSDDGTVLVPKIVAAGMGNSLALPEIRDKVISLTSKSSSPSNVNVVYIGTASYDRQDRYEVQTKGFKDAGCKIFKLNISEDETVPNYSKLRQIIVTWADVIICSGGNTLYALIRWKELGVDLLLKEAAEDGVVLCGGSAGCVCWFSNIHTDSMRPDSVKNPPKDLTPEEIANWEYVRITGLGFVNALCVPHYDVVQSNGKTRAQDSDRLVFETPELACIGIDEKAALVVVGDQVTYVSGDGAKSKCYKKYVADLEKERLAVLPIAPETEPISIRDLLTVSYQ